MEKVYLECHQTNPSNVGYDTASDDPNNPNWHVVWSDDINKRILPVCVVTCKTSAIQPPVKLKISSFQLTYSSRVFLEIKKRIPIALIPALEDIYDTFKKDLSNSRFAMYKKRVHALIGDEKRKEIMTELYLLEQ
ncbi:hypothetical protein TSUD_308480 [Trifolium subterraneum]|nr:hypothetical protein TSUD_308480 [Trifolium subterraneum]